MVDSRNRAEVWKRVLPYIRRIVHGCLKASAAYRVPLLGAISFIVLAMSQRVNPGVYGSKRVVYVGSAVNLSDMRSIARLTTGVKVYDFNRLIFRPVLEHFFSDQIPKESEYHHDESTVKNREALDEFTDALVGWIQRLWKIDGLISSNTGYIDQQSFIRSVRKQGAWSLILFKEGFCHPEQFVPIYRELKRGEKGNCDRFLCAAEYIAEGFRQLIEEGVINNLSKKSLVVTGIPRLDSYLIKNSMPEDLTLTLFAFDWKRKINVGELVESQKQQLDFGVDLIYEWILTFAERNPAAEIVVKTKGEKDPAYRKIRLLLKEKTQLGHSVDNVTLTFTEAAEDLIRRSKRLISFSSTTLIEGLLVGKPIASPDFRHILENRAWNIFDGFDDLVFYTRTYDDFEGWMKSENPACSSEARRNELIDKYFRNTDGRASSRVASEIMRLCQRS